jgi:hypothetical protein
MAESKIHVIPGFVYCTKCETIRHMSNRCSHDQRYWKLVYQRSFAAQNAKDETRHAPQHSNGAEPTEITPCIGCGKPMAVHEVKLCASCATNFEKPA